jgi:thioredoxin
MKFLIAILLTTFSLQAEAVSHITKKNLEEVLSSEYVIIDVYADWCGPCRKFGPIFEEVANLEGSKYRFAKADVDGDGAVSAMYQVSSVPTTLFIKNKLVVGRHTGAMSKETFQKKIKEYFK